MLRQKWNEQTEIEPDQLVYDEAIFVLADSDSVEGFTRYVALPCNKSLDLSPVQLVQLNYVCVCVCVFVSVCLSACLNSPKSFIYYTSLLSKVTATLHQKQCICNQPWDLGSSLGHKQSPLSVIWYLWNEL